MTILPRRFSYALLATLGSALSALAAPAIAPAAEGQIIVRYEPGTGAQERSAARSAADVVRDEAVGLARAELVTPETGTSVSEAAADLERAPGVAYAEPDQVRRAFAVPDDRLFDVQWGLENPGGFWLNSGMFYPGTANDDIGATEAWDLTTDASGVIVAVVDSGVDSTHPDLHANVVSGGWDFVDSDADPNDANGHGTHVAGTIGAQGNNGRGVAGVAWKARILPIRVLDAGGSGSLSDVIAGYAWAGSHHASIVNLSLGGAEPSQAEYDTIRALPNVLFVTAAGNDGADADQVDSYPCAYDLPNVLCVAATGSNDELAGFSNYGANSVDLAAPGVHIASTWPGGRYMYEDGTSMATPQVSGAAALVWGRTPTLTAWQARQVLVNSVHRVAGLAGKVASGGRLDAAAALNATPPAADGEPVAALIAPAPRRKQTAPVADPTADPAPAPQPLPAAPATTAPQAPAPLLDTTAPALAVILPARAPLRTVLTRGIRVPASCSERCTLRVDVTLAGRTAERLGLSKRAATVLVATGTAAVAKGASASVTVRFSAKARRALGRVRSVRTAVRSTATDAAGNRRARTGTLTLVR